ncbi:hypothetical protein R1sor_024295 [Riccia sorocarpa]|uniref:Uncharacterized protein n=1 Tax=Riccia sorocarpa TaxID=122646 RepID=A0ABD3GU47_9MARC
MATHQSNYDAAKDTIGQKTEDTKNYGADKTNQAGEHAQGIGETAKAKAGEVKDSTVNAGQTAKDKTASTGQAAKDKAGEATGNAGSVVQQAGEKLKEGWESTKNTVTGNN